MNVFKKIIRRLMNENGRKLFTEYKVPINGIDISILETSNQGNKTLLLMPILFGSKWTSFGPQLKELPVLLPEYKIVAWDPPGCGKSVPPERNFCLQLFQNDAHMAVELMKTLKHNNFSVLGWGDGGIAALIMAGRFPEFIDKLIVWGSGAYVTERELNSLKRSSGLNKLDPDFRNMLIKLYGKKHLTKLWEHWIKLLCDFRSTCKGDFCAAEVDCIQAPTLILHGGEDVLTDPEHVKFLQKHIRSSTSIELPEGGFEMHLTHSKEFNEQVSKFLLEK